MFQKHLILVVTLLSLPLFQSSAPAGSGLIGSRAPYFSVQSGDDKELTLDMIKGKVVAIFYENRKIVGANKRLKDELNRPYYEQRDALKDVLVRLPVIDCSDAIWPFHGLWKRKLREHSSKEGTTIYYDWSGKMASAYRMKDDVSNVVIIDKAGIIRSFTSGEVAAEQIDDAKKLLKALVGKPCPYAIADGYVWMTGDTSMPQTPHIERHFTGSDIVKDVVIGMSDGLTVPFALAPGLSGATWTSSPNQSIS